MQIPDLLGRDRTLFPLHMSNLAINNPYVIVWRTGPSSVFSSPPPGRRTATCTV
jgi:hypothetical protein